MLTGPLLNERQGVGSETGCDHVGDDGARLGEVDGGECWVHRGLPQLLASIAQISLIISRILRKFSINSETRTCTPSGT
jgi:hypothetical protein